MLWTIKLSLLINLRVMHQSIETPGPRPPGHSGQFNLYPGLKPGAKKSIKSPVQWEHPNTGTKYGNNSNRRRRLGHVVKVELSFLSLKTPGLTIMFPSVIIICSEKWPFNRRKLMYKSTLCWVLTNSKSLKLGKNYADFGLTQMHRVYLKYKTQLVQLITYYSNVIPQ